MSAVSILSSLCALCCLWPSLLLAAAAAVVSGSVAGALGAALARLRSDVNFRASAVLYVVLFACVLAYAGVQLARSAVMHAFSRRGEGP